MSKTYHRKWHDKFDDYQANKKRKFKDRRNKRRKVYAEKNQYINVPKDFEGADL